MSLLAAYYDAVNAEKYAARDNLWANARNTDAQTGEVAADHAAQRGLQNSQAGEAGQRGRLAGAQAGQVGLNDAAQRNLQGSQAGLYGMQTKVLPGVSASENALRAAQAGGIDTAAQVASQGLGLSTLGGNVGDAPGSSNDDPTGAPGDTSEKDPTQGDSKGGKIKTEKQVLQGKANKPGPTDTVPAMLTPGEAVLNKGAAEHYGSDVIDHMNRMGLLRMGAQSEHAAIHGQPDPHAKPPAESDAKKKGAKGKMVAGGAAPTGNAPPVPVSPQPAGGAPHPLPGALPGFWQGTSAVTPSSAGPGMIPWTQTPAPTMQGSTDLAVAPHYGTLASPPTAHAVIMLDHGLGGRVALPTMTPR